MALFARASSPISLSARPRWTKASPDGAAACDVGQLAQRRQRRPALAREDVGAVGEHRETAGAGITGVVPDRVLVVGDGACRQAGDAFLQALEEEFDGAFLDFGRHVEALFARVNQEVADVGRQPVLVLGEVSPQAEATVWRLHAGQPGDGLVEHFGPLCLGEGFEREFACRRRVDEDVRIGAAGRLLGAAVGVAQQALHGVAHVDRRLVRDGQRRGHVCRRKPPSSASRTSMLSPGAMESRLSTVWRGVGACTCSGKRRSILTRGLSTRTCISVRPRALPASIGMRRLRFC
jgi:hypothetical protein